MPFWSTDNPRPTKHQAWPVVAVPPVPPILSTSFEGTSAVGSVTKPTSALWAATGAFSGWYRGDYESVGEATLAGPVEDWLDITFTLRVPSTSTLVDTLRVIGISNKLDVRAGKIGADAIVYLPVWGDNVPSDSAVAGPVDTDIDVRLIVDASSSALYVDGSSVAAKTGPGYPGGFGWSNPVVSLFHDGNDNYAGLDAVFFVDDLIVTTGTGTPPTP